MIRFIVCGWHYNQSSLIDGLHELQKRIPDTIHVFWSCHREPTDEIKQKFPLEWSKMTNDESQLNQFEIQSEYHLLTVHQALVPWKNQILPLYLGRFGATTIGYSGSLFLPIPANRCMVF